MIPFLHWGREGSPEPKASQRELARRLIDAGAAVIGAHPHVTQTVDIYKGRPIVYSWGIRVRLLSGRSARLDRLDCEGHVSPFGRDRLETLVCEIDKAGMPHLVSRASKGST